MKKNCVLFVLFFGSATSSLGQASEECITNLTQSSRYDDINKIFTCFSKQVKELAVKVGKLEDQVAKKENSQVPFASQTPVKSQIPVKTFSENFDSPSPNWRLDGSTRLSQGKLVITALQNQWVSVPIPTSISEEGFLAEADMMLLEGHPCYSDIGFGFGNGKGVSVQNRFLLMGSCTGSRVGLYENTTEVFSTPVQGLMNQKITYRVGIECKKKTCTLYIDGKAIESSSVKPYEDKIFFIARLRAGFGSTQKSTFSYDNLTIDKR